MVKFGSAQLGHEWLIDWIDKLMTPGISFGENSQSEFAVLIELCHCNKCL